MGRSNSMRGQDGHDNRRSDGEKRRDYLSLGILPFCVVLASHLSDSPFHEVACSILIFLKLFFIFELPLCTSTVRGFWGIPPQLSQSVNKCSAIRV